MSLLCREDGLGLLTTEQAYCVTVQTADTVESICQAHFGAIPVEKRLLKPIEGGLDIHFLFSTPTWGRLDLPDILTLTGANVGEYRFSIPGDVARIVLPQCFQLFLGPST